MVDRSEFAEEFEPERYELNEGPPYRFELDRRVFLGFAGGGLLISSACEDSRAQRVRSRGREAAPIEARLQISENGAIQVFTSKVEVGQGSRTQLTQAVAEEMRVPTGRVRLVMADTDLTPNDGATAGSRTTPSTVPAVRRAAAAARKILLETAARKWNVAPEKLEVRDGAVRAPDSKRTLSYAELARSEEVVAAFRNAPPREVSLRAPGEWKVMGESLPNIEGRAIVTGAHRFPSDIVRPGMLYGAILRPPAYGARLSDVDLTPAREMEGVTAVRDGEFVGFAAATSRLANAARGAVAKTARWKHSPQPSSEELFPYLKAHAVREGTGRRRPRGRDRGSLEEGFSAATKLVEASYEVSYVQHAPMEPRAAVAEWEGGRLTVWTGTQRPNGVRGQLSEAFLISADNVRVIVPDTGGGFGGKHTGEVAIEAARLARAARRPVSLRWTREEEFQWAYFRPAGLIEVRAGIDARGAITAWEFTNFNSGAAALESPYAIPHSRTQFLFCDSPLREGSYRGIAATANNFARESFMDELAAAANADPLEFRLLNLEDERLRAVLEAAAERFGWKERKRKRPKDVGVGLAGGLEKGSYVATCVEVALDREKGEIKVNEICATFECGAIQNPRNLRAQVVGSVIMGLGGALSEEIRFENGRLLNGSFGQYPVPRFHDVPRIESILLDRPDLPSVGAGETPIIAVAPAIANAVFDACGVRIRSMPVRGAALKKA